MGANTGTKCFWTTQVKETFPAEIKELFMEEWLMGIGPSVWEHSVLLRADKEVQFSWAEKLQHKSQVTFMLKYRKPEAIVMNIYFWLMLAHILST